MTVPAVLLMTPGLNMVDPALLNQFPSETVFKVREVEEKFRILISHPETGSGFPVRFAMISMSTYEFNGTVC